MKRSTDGPPAEHRFDAPRRRRSFSDDVNYPHELSRVRPTPSAEHDVFQARLTGGMRAGPRPAAPAASSVAASAAHTNFGQAHNMFLDSFAPAQQHHPLPTLGHGYTHHQDQHLYHHQQRTPTQQQQQQPHMLQHRGAQAQAQQQQQHARLQQHAARRQPPLSNKQHLDDQQSPGQQHAILPQMPQPQMPQPQTLMPFNSPSKQQHAQHAQAVQQRHQQQPHHSQQHARRHESIPSMPSNVQQLMHPNPLSVMTPADAAEGDRANNLAFERQVFLDDFPQDDNPLPTSLPPPPQLATVQENEQGNTLAGVDSITGIGIGMPGGIPRAPSIPSLPLPSIPSGTGYSGSILHGIPGVGAPSGLGNPALVGGAHDISDTLDPDRRHTQRRPRQTRGRNQQMTEQQRKQRHNEHTRASRVRIDKGLESLKRTLKLVRPQLKLGKKADVVYEAVKLIKEGFNLPPTESDNERDEQESSMSP